MEDYFANYLSDTHWQIFEKGWDPELQNVNESKFALGNGYIGSRAILEENPPNCRPGTFFAGIYEGSRALVPELVNAPNPIDLRISVDGEKLDVTAMEVLNHKRILDMYKGILVRRTTYSNARKKRFDYQSMRFFSMHNKHIAAMQVYITPLDEEATFTITNAVDTSIMNMGLVTEGDKKHVDVVEFDKFGNVNCVCTKTIENKILIIYASQIIIKKGRKTYSPPHWTFKIHLKKGESACITNYLSFYTSRDASAMEETKKNVVKLVTNSVRKGIDRLFREHSKAWEKKWKSANIEIDGDPNIERAIRFNIYHLLIATDESCNDVGIGAKALTGEGYRGHVFWDAEIFCLPFFIYTNPSIARNLLLYRYHRLDAARKIAKEKGYEGAMFPWESADTGEETTPSWYKDSSGKVKKVLTMEQECHITADIAYAVVHYFSATNDVDFLLNYGLEIILETARFWASRVEYNKKKKRYEINHVMGPDEFHENINNNAYTNILVQWNLKIAAKLCRVFQRRCPAEVKALMSRINLKSSELENWRQIASKIYIPISKKTGIIEQFEGFFKKKRLPLPELDRHSLPIYPKNINIGDTQYVKQADVVMALFLLSDNFSLKIKRKNYLYYEKRTLHKSSLSPSIYAALGAEIGEENKAYHYFEIATYIDLKNIYGNTNMGIHAASLGGLWQALIHGFAGIRLRKGILTFNPRLPSSWKRFKTIIKYRGYDILTDIDEEKVNLYFRSKRKRDWLTVRVYGNLQRLPANKKVSFHKKHKKKIPYEIEFY